MALFHPLAFVYISFFLNYLWCFARFVQFVWRPCRESGIHVKWKDCRKNKKNRVWMLRGPCWCCWRGLREFGFLSFFFFEHCKTRNTGRRKAGIHFWSHLSVDEIWFMHHLNGSRKRFQISLISVCGFMAQPFIPVIRQAVFNQTANNVRNGDERPKSTHAYTHRHTHFVTAVGFSSRIHGRSQWQQVLKQG